MKQKIPRNCTIKTIIISLTVIISITLSIRFFERGKYCLHLKPSSFPIQNNLYCSAFHLIILADFLLNLVSCTQPMFKYLCYFSWPTCKWHYIDSTNCQFAHLLSIEAVPQRFSAKNMFLKITHNWLKNSCAGNSFLIKRLRHRCFPMNFAKFLTTPFLESTCCGCFCF